MMIIIQLSLRRANGGLCWGMFIHFIEIPIIIMEQMFHFCSMFVVSFPSNGLLLICTSWLHARQIDNHQFAFYCCCYSSWDRRYCLLNQEVRYYLSPIAIVTFIFLNQLHRCTRLNGRHALGFFFIILTERLWVNGSGEAEALLGGKEKRRKEKTKKTCCNEPHHSNSWLECRLRRVHLYCFFFIRLFFRGRRVCSLIILSLFLLVHFFFSSRFSWKALVRSKIVSSLPYSFSLLSLCISFAFSSFPKISLVARRLFFFLFTSLVSTAKRTHRHTHT